MSSAFSNGDAAPVLGGRISSRFRPSVVYMRAQDDPSSPPSGYVAVFMACFHVGFRLSLSWLMMEYCIESQLAPGQLILQSWGLIHALQVLSDLTGINISGKMIARAFVARPVEMGSRRYKLRYRPGRNVHRPVQLPSHLGLIQDYGDFIFVRHEKPARLPFNWSPIGSEPFDRFPTEEFPADLFRLPVELRDSAFLLHREVVARSSLAATPEHPFMRSEFVGTLFSLWASLKLREHAPPLPAIPSRDEHPIAPHSGDSHAILNLDEGSSSSPTPNLPNSSFHVSCLQCRRLKTEKDLLRREVEALRSRISLVNLRVADAQAEMSMLRDLLDSRGIYYEFPESSEEMNCD